MKKLLLIILLVLPVTSFGQFWKPKPKAKPSPTPVLVEKSKTPVQDAKQIVKELQGELKVAKDENAKLKNNLSNAQNELNNSFTQIDKLKKDIDTLKEWGVVQQAEAQKWLEKYTNAIKRYHRLKWIAALIAAAGGVLLGLQIMGFVPPPYNLLVPIGGAGFFGALVWFFL
jgi:polyhydroxyalkanoate synthesis regulator phasin